MQPSEVAEILDRPLSKELLARPMTRMSYVATDGTPRVIPTGFAWNGSTLVTCTPPNAPKLRHLRANPSVALTIDTEEHPPHILLIRGEAALDPTDGIPDEFLQLNGANGMTDEQRAGFETEVRATYVDGMVRIVITPTWAKLIDFETTLPQAVAEMAQRRAEREAAAG